VEEDEEVGAVKKSETTTAVRTKVNRCLMSFGEATAHLAERGRIPQA
jgi:hypothetical protein